MVRGGSYQVSPGFAPRCICSPPKEVLCMKCKRRGLMKDTNSLLNYPKRWLRTTGTRKEQSVMTSTLKLKESQLLISRFSAQIPQQDLEEDVHPDINPLLHLLPNTLLPQLHELNLQPEVNIRIYPLRRLRNHILYHLYNKLILYLLFLRMSRVSMIPPILIRRGQRDRMGRG
jgi:hypothetical protein